jgi:hypothetical protein
MKTNVIILSCSVILCAFGCRPNSRFYFKQNIELVARLQSGSAEYDTVEIGNPNQWFCENLSQYEQLTIELSEQEVVRLSDLTVKMLKKAAIKTKTLNTANYDTGWPNDSESLEVRAGLFFIVQGDRILNLSASSVQLKDGEKPPRLGRKDLELLYVLPMSQTQVLELFGQPDKQSDIWHGDITECCG